MIGLNQEVCDCIVTRYLGNVIKAGWVQKSWRPGRETTHLAAADQRMQGAEKLSDLTRVLKVYLWKCTFENGKKVYLCNQSPSISCLKLNLTTHIANFTCFGQILIKSDYMPASIRQIWIASGLLFCWTYYASQFWQNHWQNLLVIYEHIFPRHFD